MRLKDLCSLNLNNSNRLWTFSLIFSVPVTDTRPEILELCGLSFFYSCLHNFCLILLEICSLIFFLWHPSFFVPSYKLSEEINIAYLGAHKLLCHRLLTSWQLYRTFYLSVSCRCLNNVVCKNWHSVLNHGLGLIVLVQESLCVEAVMANTKNKI